MGPKWDVTGPERDMTGPERDVMRPERDVAGPERDMMRPERDVMKPSGTRRDSDGTGCQFANLSAHGQWSPAGIGHRSDQNLQR